MVLHGAITFDNLGNHYSWCTDAFNYHLTTFLIISNIVPIEKCVFFWILFLSLKYMFLPHIFFNRKELGIIPISISKTPISYLWLMEFYYLHEDSILKFERTSDSKIGLFLYWIYSYFSSILFTLWEHCQENM